MKRISIKKICVSLIAIGLTQYTFANVEQFEAVPGEYVVKLKNDVKSLTDLNLEKFATQGVRVISEENNTILVKREFLEKTQFALTALNNQPEIEYAEPNYIYRTNRLPDDPELSKLWGLVNKGNALAGVDIGAEQAWDIQTGSKKVIVAVIDTGVDYTLSDLSPNMWTNDAELNGEAGKDDDGNGYIDDVYGYDFANTDSDPIDDHGHGSHCSGTIGAKGNDGKGLVGVAWNVRIMALKFLTKSGSGSLEGALKSIDYASKMGANIMSNSWGGGSHSQALEDAIKRASDAGALFVAAAGNHSGDNDAKPTYPATYDVENVVSVAAIDNNGRLAGFSCYGQKTVDVAAPGVGILSSTPGGYKSWSGTSMATPHVSGIAALLLSEFPEMTHKEIKERLIATAKPLSQLRVKTVAGGVANAYYALLNEPAPKDPNDPYYWASKEYKLETAHPYLGSTSKQWVIELDSVSAMALHFKRFDTEKSYDKVTFKDADGNILGIMSGVNDDSFSPVVTGGKMIIQFDSDKSVNKFGFEIDAISYR
ncbi:MAG: S8 family serine peptidase [Bdellovibrionaceae bacterium]|nr:S8 family serine peptidase [Pseudobdellovibrionaceae bacterium]